MRKWTAFGLILILSIVLLVCTAETDNALTGTWKATRLISGDETLDLAGETELRLGLFLTLREDGSFETFTYRGETASSIRGSYSLLAGQQMKITVNNETSLEIYRLAGDALTLTETSGEDITVVYFERCPIQALTGSWRSVAMRVGGEEISIDGSATIGLGFRFEEDGSCTGRITSRGQDDVRQMNYYVSGGVITLVETGSISNIAYALEGETMTCVFGSLDTETGTVYTLIRE